MVKLSATRSRIAKGVFGTCGKVAPRIDQRQRSMSIKSWQFEFTSGYLRAKKRNSNVHLLFPCRILFASLKIIYISFNYLRLNISPFFYLMSLQSLTRKAVRKIHDGKVNAGTNTNRKRGITPGRKWEGVISRKREWETCTSPRGRLAPSRH